MTTDGFTSVCWSPAFVFDGRMILDHDSLVEMGYHVETIGRKVQRSELNRMQAMPKP